MTGPKQDEPVPPRRAPRLDPHGARLRHLARRHARRQGGRGGVKLLLKTNTTLFRLNDHDRAGFNDA
jgi:hypothetical protein